jgi:TonB-linked SusC/RagA family outer membrane protein
MDLAAQQGGNIVGTVRDGETGRPLESVQVFIEGTGVGALTNAAGRFLLVNVPFGDVVVRSELVGYRSASEAITVTPGESAVVELSMTQTAIALEQIVVTGAGVATERKKLGNTIASIDASQLEDAPISSFSDMIQGREPGLVGLPSSGSTGEGSRIRIRGSASLSQSNEPIVYVDGIRVDRAGGFGDNVGAGGLGSPSRLDDIPPESIERIEVLKGAAAATLYGTEASNGVIQIFTKKGRQGTPRWTLQYDGAAIQTPTDRMITHADYARSSDDQARISARWNRNVNLYDPFEIDILPDAFETGWSNALSASVSGGSDLITYFVSGRYANENGSFGLSDLGPAEDTNKKYQASANIQMFPTDNLSLRFSGLYSQVNHSTPSNANNIFGSFSSMLMGQLRLATADNLYGQRAFATTRENMQELIHQDAENFSGSINLNWQASPGWIFDATFGVNAVNQRSSDFFPFGWDVDGFTPFFTQGQREIDDRNHREVTGDFKLSWDTNFTDRISNTLLGGAQGFVNETLTSGGDGDEFPGPGLEVVGAASNKDVFENYLKVVNAGVYLQDQIGWDDYLFVTLGGRWDANSAFGEDFETAFYPKAAVSWIPSDQLDWPYSTVSTFRVRGAIGQSGLQPGAFDQFTTYSSLSSTEGPGVAPDNLGNPALKPETSTEWELGMEFGFFDDSHSLDMTYWNRTVNDALVARQFPVSGGFRSTQLDNIGEVQGHGFEIAYNGSWVNRDSWNLSVFANASYISEEVTDLGGAPPLKTGGSYPRYRNFIKEGYSPGAFFGAVIDNSKAIPLDLNGDCSEPSNAAALEYFSQPRGLSAFEVIPQNCGGAFLDTFIGKPTPDWQGSWGFNLGFMQNWEVSSLFEYKYGNYHVQDLTGMFRQANAVIGRNIPEAARVGAILENPASSAQQRLDAALYWANNLRALAPMSGMNGIHAADFMRWRELSLTYRFPGSLADRLRLSNGAITLGVRNLALWVNDDYTGIDPEINALGRCSDGSLDCNFLSSVEAFGVPVARRFTFSVRFGF